VCHNTHAKVIQGSNCHHENFNKRTVQANYAIPHSFGCPFRLVYFLPPSAPSLILFFEHNALNKRPMMSVWIFPEISSITLAKTQNNTGSKI